MIGSESSENAKDIRNNNRPDVAGRIAGEHRVMVTSAKAPNANERYRARKAIANRRGADDNSELRYLHQGGRYDSLTGTNDFRNRMYSPTMMRWMQQDPMGYVDGLNDYQALGDNPINYTDLLGEASGDSAVAGARHGSIGVPTTMPVNDNKEHPFTWLSWADSLDIPTVISSADIVGLVDTPQYVRVRVVKQKEGYKSARAPDFLRAMRGTDFLDTDSAQVVAVSFGDGIVSEATNFSRYPPSPWRRQAADWELVDKDTVQWDLPVLPCAKRINVVLIYTDAINTTTDLPVVFGAWEFSSKGGGKWTVAQKAADRIDVRTIPKGTVSAGDADKILDEETKGLYRLQHRDFGGTNTGFDIVRKETWLA